MNDKINKFMDENKRALVFSNLKNTEILYCNQQMKDLYPVESNNFTEIFQDKNIFMLNFFQDEMKEKDRAFYYDIVTKKVDGTFQLADIQVGYLDREASEIFVEITPKDDIRMEMARSQVNQANRAEGIFLLDERLTLVHCNDLFHDVFESNQEQASSVDGKELANGFQAESREQILQEIHENLKHASTYQTKLKLMTTKGKQLWYSIELQKRTLDCSGIDKVMVYLLNIENQVEMEEELKDVNQYFSILQSMSKGLLYRYDIRNRSLYRNNDTAQRYRAPSVTENFPQREWLNKVLHPEDIDSFIQYMDVVAGGKEAAHKTRLLSPEGVYEHYHFEFKPVVRSDGTIQEMVGFASNESTLKETELQLANINQYFKIIQMETSCIILRYDIKNRILHRNADIAKEQGLPSFVENYPNQEEVNRVVHPEDAQSYLDFFDKVSRGEEGVYYCRLLTIDGSYNHHSLNFCGVKSPDGEIREMLIIVLNIHNLKEKEIELANVNRQFDALQELSEDVLFRVDMENQVLIQSKDKFASFGINKEIVDFPQEIIENGFIHPEDTKIYRNFAAHALSGVGGTTEVRMKEEDKETYGYRRLTWIPVENDEGRINEMVGKIVDIQSVKDLEEQAKYDGLTKAMNKFAILESATQILVRAKPEDRHALFFMDLDNFKYVNDHLGHTFGDFLLGELGQRLKNGLRYHDLLGRVGGDEFVMFLRDVQNIDVLMGKAKMLLSAISEDFSDGNIHHNIHGSLGIAVFPDHGTTYEELYHHADLALYASKHKGKNTVTLYTEDLKEE
ncbi:MAG: diguanylate cyclase [Eubacteriales bacterium]